VEEGDIQTVVEGMLAPIFEKLLQKEITLPLRRIPYETALARYGTDKPDLRFEMLIEDVTGDMKGAAFKVFEEALERGERIKAIAFPAPRERELSRKDFDDLTQFVTGLGAKGLVWMKVKAGDEVDSPVAKFFEKDRIQRLIKKLAARPGDALFMAAAPELQAVSFLGALRVHLAQQHRLIPQDTFELAWVVDFPLFEWSEEEKRYAALHHPFTSPCDSDVTLLEKAPEKVRAKAYDLVMNGVEIGGGSIRIHRREVQEKVFRVLKLTDKEAEEKFGFLLKALGFGAPPHGGIALGVDRLVTLLRGKDSIREVIAFPKTQKGTCLMTGAPSSVSAKQLKELHIKGV